MSSHVGLADRFGLEPPGRLLAVAVVLGGVTAGIAAQGRHTTSTVLTYLLAAGFVLLVAIRPGPALAGLLGWMPISLVALSLLYRYGVPGPAVRAMGGIKDAVTIGLVLAVARRPQVHRRFGALDSLAVGYVVLVTAYLLLPSVVPGLLGNAQFHVRVLAWRNDVVFVALFVAARHADIDPVWRRRIGVTVVAVGLLLSACALYEVAAPSSWDHFMTSVAQTQTFRQNVLGDHSAVGSVLTYTDVGGHQALRAGSLLANPLTLPFLLLVPFGLLLQAVADARHAFWAAVGAMLVGAAIVATLTRSAILGAVVAVVAALVVAARSRAPGRLALGLIVVAALAVVAPVAASTTLAARIADSGKGNVDTTGHINHTIQGLRVALDHPLGKGLATVAGTGQRFSVQGTVVAENSYLQVADEVGVVPMAMFVVLLVGVLVLLARALSRPPRRWLAGGLLVAGLGLAAGGFLLQVWIDYSTSLTFWGAAGVTLAASSREQLLVDRQRLLGRALPRETGRARPAALAQGRG